jgi:GTP cyclohydrolase II
VPIRYVESSRLPTQWGEFEMHGFKEGGPVLTRIHSECLTGDALFSLRQEGRGIGLLNKIKAYKLQDAGADTVEANEALGFRADMRDYSIAKPMLDHLHIIKVKLMTNNPRKVKALEEQGIEVSERIEIHAPHNPNNQKYLATKAGKLGHLMG